MQCGSVWLMVGACVQCGSVRWMVGAYVQCGAVWLHGWSLYIVWSVSVAAAWSLYDLHAWRHE